MLHDDPGPINPRPVLVRCPRCGEVHNESDVVFIDIAEDMEGRDVLTFTCPHCGEDVQSLRFG